ncbi:MAG: hypothetical protein KAY37_01380 [Phycisphaerae bacterium]|nr:hypothetical protein [Phycisphaerae bacterium]
MADEIIKELWEVKDSIAREHGYDVDALVAHLRAKQRPEAQRIVDLHALRKNAEQGASTDAPSSRGD